MVFFYAKLNFSYKMPIGGPADHYNAMQYLEKVLDKQVEVVFRDNPFVFTDGQRVEVGGVTYLVGKITKYADRSERTLNPSTKAVSEVKVENKIIAESMFIVDFSENLLLYSEASGHINKNSFIERFNALVELGSGDMPYSCVAVKISEKYAFLEALKSLDLVYELVLKIRPTNPNPIDIIEAIDKKLKEKNVSEQINRYKAKSGGLNLKSKEIEGNSVYADIGYGEGVGKGYKDGKSVTVRSTKGDKQKNINLGAKPLSGTELAQMIHKLVNEKKD